MALTKPGTPCARNCCSSSMLGELSTTNTKSTLLQRNTGPSPLELSPLLPRVSSSSESDAVVLSACELPSRSMPGPLVVSSLLAPSSPQAAASSTTERMLAVVFLLWKGCMGCESGPPSGGQLVGRVLQAGCGGASKVLVDDDDVVTHDGDVVDHRQRAGAGVVDP